MEMESVQMKTKIIQSGDDCTSFGERDLLQLVKQETSTHVPILCIDYVEVPHKLRNQGMGTRVLKQFCEECQ